MHKKTLDSILFIFIAAAVILSAINFSLIVARGEKMKNATLLAEKENQPARLELIKIAASSCQDCFAIDVVIESLKKANVNITSERTLDRSSAEAKQLIKKYNIEKMPTVVVLGEVNKSAVVNLWNQNWQVEMKDGTQVSAVYAAVNPPYVDVNGSIKGIVFLTHIVDYSCQECANLTPLIDAFKHGGVKFSSEKIIDYSSSEGKELISQFSIQKIPALIISKDILEYKDAARIWAQLNATEKQGFYALHTTAPPYRDLTTDRIEGLVSVIYLADKECTSCHDVQINKQILEKRLGMVIINETSADISSVYGKTVIKQYNVTRVPMILVSPGASGYARFVTAWQDVGDIASDGWYVMRKPEALGIYKDLLTGQVVTPQRG